MWQKCGKTEIQVQGDIKMVANDFSLMNAFSIETMAIITLISAPTIMFLGFYWLKLIKYYLGDKDNCRFCNNSLSETEIKEWLYLRRKANKNIRYGICFNCYAKGAILRFFKQFTWIALFLLICNMAFAQTSKDVRSPSMCIWVEITAKTKIASNGIANILTSNTTSFMSKNVDADRKELSEDVIKSSESYVYVARVRTKDFVLAQDIIDKIVKYISEIKDALSHSRFQARNPCRGVLFL